MALRVRGESVDEIAGAVRAMRGKMTKVDAPDGAIDIVGTGGDASGHLQHLHLRRLRRGGRRRAGRQARQPGAFVEIRRRRHARRARRQYRAEAGADRHMHPRGRHRLHVRAGPPFRHAPCRPLARGARHPHRVQPARAAVQSGERQALHARRLRARMGGADRRGARLARRGARLGRARHLRRQWRHRRDIARPASPMSPS